MTKSILCIFFSCITFISHAQILTYVGRTTQVDITADNQKSDTCNIEIAFPNGTSIQKEITKANPVAKVEFAPNQEGPNKIEWKGKLRLRGLSTTFACDGQGSVIVNALSLSEFNSVKWSELTSNYNSAKLVCLDNGLKSLKATADLKDVATVKDINFEDQGSKNIRSICEQYGDYQLKKDKQCKNNGIDTLCNEAFLLTIGNEKVQIDFNDIYPKLFVASKIEIINKETESGKQSRIEKEIARNKNNGPVNIDSPSDNTINKFTALLACSDRNERLHIFQVNQAINAVMQGGFDYGGRVASSYGCRAQNTVIQNSKFLSKLNYFGERDEVGVYSLQIDEGMSALVIGPAKKNLDLNRFKSYETTNSPLLQQVFSKKWMMGISCKENGGTFVEYSDKFPIGEAMTMGGKRNINDSQKSISIFQVTGPNTFTHTYAMYAEGNALMMEATNQNPDFRVFKAVKFYELVSPNKLVYKGTETKFNFDQLLKNKKVVIENTEIQGTKQDCDSSATLNFDNKYKPEIVKLKNSVCYVSADQVKEYNLSTCNIDDIKSKIETPDQKRKSVELLVFNPDMTGGAKILVTNSITAELFQQNSQNLGSKWKNGFLIEPFTYSKNESLIKDTAVADSQKNCLKTYNVSKGKDGLELSFKSGSASCSDVDINIAKMIDSRNRKWLLLSKQ
jgi:hypothetical protein